jgi:hypothetical protein
VGYLKAWGAVYGKVVEIVEWGGEELLEAGVSGRVSRGRLAGCAEWLGLRRANSKTCEDGDDAEVDVMRD